MARHMMQRDMLHNDMARTMPLSPITSAPAPSGAFIGTPILPPDTKRRL